MACHAPKLCHDVTERKSIQFPRRDLDKKQKCECKKKSKHVSCITDLIFLTGIIPTLMACYIILQQLLRTCRLTAVQATGTQHPTEHAGAVHGDRLLTLESLNTVQMHIQQNGATRRVELPSNKVSLKKLFH